MNATIRPRPAPRAAGFSLLELTVVLVLLGIIGVLLVRWIGLDAEDRAQAAQRDLLQRADDALLAFAAANARLPCPAADATGAEDCTRGQVGQLPYATLGLPDARAGRIRYGVLRRPDAALDNDADLAVVRDRAHTLQVLTAVSGAIVAATRAPDTCDVLATGAVTCADQPQLALNGLDLCRALRNAIQLPASSDFVHTRRDDAPAALAGNVAYALALPHAPDAAPEHTGTSVAFASPRRPGTPDYQDKVHAVGLDQLWTRLRCGDSVGPATYGHPNVAAAAALTVPSMDDFEEQLGIMLDLAVANDLSADAGIVAAVAQIGGATAGVLDTIGETFNTYGAWNWRVAVATAGIATAVGAVVAAGIAKADASKSVADARSTLADFSADFPPTSRILAGEIGIESQRADMLGVYPDPAARDTALQFGSAGGATP